MHDSYGLFGLPVTRANARCGDVACGRFGMKMSGVLTNEGTVMFWLES
jgi:D-Tyr-tRNAtyr deacylase